MKMKRICVLMLLLLILPQTSCGEASYERYQVEYYDIFDTHTSIICYAKSQMDFDKYTKLIHDRLSELNKYFDIYNTYEGLNNIKTLNDQAGIAPVEVSEEIIQLLLLSKQAYHMTSGTVNIALGPMLSVWHDYREKGLQNPALAELPRLDVLKEALKNTDIDKIIIDEKMKTVFLENAGMLLDVGAIAKGFAAQLTIDEAKKHGVSSCLLNIGGNISVLGKPMDNVRQRWGVGVQNPTANAGSSDSILDTIYANDISIVTSGDYQRYYTVDAVRYHHIIDPETLMPASKYRAVTIGHEDSGIADILSTALFILPYERGRDLAEVYGASVLWVLADGTVIINERYEQMSKTYGGYSAID